MAADCSARRQRRPCWRTRARSQTNKTIAAWLCGEFWICTNMFVAFIVFLSRFQKVGIRIWRHFARHKFEIKVNYLNRFSARQKRLQAPLFFTLDLRYEAREKPITQRDRESIELINGHGAKENDANTSIFELLKRQSSDGRFEQPLTAQSKIRYTCCSTRQSIGMQMMSARSFSQWAVSRWTTVAHRLFIANNLWWQRRWRHLQPTPQYLPNQKHKLKFRPTTTEIMPSRHPTRLPTTTWNNKPLTRTTKYSAI